jgi:drug/metabolite transporter (DMT)-like permease
MNGLLLLVVIFSAAGQILIKKGADRTLPNQQKQQGASSGTAKLLLFLARAANPWLIAGIATVALVPLLYMRLLADMELSRAYGATGLSYPLVVFGSAFFLREQIGIRHMAGSLLILAGFLIWNSGL